MKIEAHICAWVWVLCVLESSAWASDPCGALRLIEVNAALRGPGQVLSERVDLSDKKASGCYFKRVTGGIYLTAAALHAANGPEVSIFIPDAGAPPVVDPKTMDTERDLPSLGDRATIVTGSEDKSPAGRSFFRVTVISGSRSFMLIYHPGVVEAQSQATAVQLAREVLDGQFLGDITSYPIAERVVADDKTEVMQKPDRVELWNEIGLLSYGLKRYEDARNAYRKITQLLPDDPGGYVGIALADFHRSYAELTELRRKLGIPPGDTLALDSKYKDQCEAFKKDFRVVIDEGYENIMKALELRPRHSIAVCAAFLDHLRADTDCGDDAAVKADNSEATRLPQTFPYDPKSDLFPQSYSSKVAVGLHGFDPFPSILVSRPPSGTLAATRPKVETPGPVRVSSSMENGLLLSKVDPVYPSVAHQAGIQGTVSLQALIGKDGNVEHLELISGHPLLAPAAIDAVKQWKYKPYLLNGQAVEVQTEVQVNFSLQNDPSPGSPASATQPQN